jgi:asparagine synthase (glutamine-hydrolysing)
MHHLHGFYSLHSEESSTQYGDNKGVSSHVSISWSSADKRLFLSETPIVSHCHRYVLVLRGNIYNHRQIRLGLRFNSWKSDSPSETLVEAIAQRGASLVLDLRGSFVFAAYDLVSGQLLLARDRIGLQSLYVCSTNASFHFSTTPIDLPGCLDFNPSSISQHLLFGSYLSPCSFPSQETNGATSFPSGLVVRLNHSRPHIPVRYWPPHPRPDWGPLPLCSIRNSASFLRRLISTVLEEQVSIPNERVCLLLHDVPSLCLQSILSTLRPLAVKSLTINFSWSHDQSPVKESVFSDPIFASHHCHTLDSHLSARWLHDGLNGPNLYAILDPRRYLYLRCLSELGFSSSLCSVGASDLFGNTKLHRISFLTRALSWLPRTIQHHLIGLLAPNIYSDSYSPNIELDVFCGAHFSDLNRLSFNDSGLPLPPLPALPKHTITQLWGQLSWTYLFARTQPLSLCQNNAFAYQYGLNIHAPYLDHRIVELAARTPHRFHASSYGLILKAFPEILPFVRLPSLRGLYSIPVADLMLGPMRETCQERLSMLADAGWINSVWIRDQWSLFECGRLRWSRAWSLVLLGEHARRLTA